MSLHIRKKKEKQTLQLWQMIILILLPLTVIVFAFFVRIQISSEKISDLYRDVLEDAAGKISDEINNLPDWLEKFGDYFYSDPDDLAREMEQRLEKIMERDMSFTGWELLSFSDEMMLEKMLYTIGKDSKGEKTIVLGIYGKIKEILKRFLEDSDAFREISSIFWYVRTGYRIFYGGLVLLIIMAILWYIVRWDKRWFIVVNLVVSIVSLSMTLPGTVNVDNYIGISHFWGSSGSWAEYLLNPVYSFIVAVNATHSGIVSTVVCSLMFFFAVYLLIDYLVRRHTEKRKGDEIK